MSSYCCWKSLSFVLLALGLASCSQSNGDNSGSGGPGGRGGSASSAGGTGSGQGGSSVASGGASTQTSSSTASTAAGGSSASGGKSSAGTSSPGGTAGASVASSTNNGGTAGKTGGGGATGGSSTPGVSSATGGQGGGGAGGASARDAGPAGGSDASAPGPDGATGGSVGGQPGNCPAGSKPGDGKRTVTVGTASRTYYLHVPTKYDGTKPVPLVVDFHGKGGNGTDEAKSNPYRSVIDTEGVLSACPDGLNGDWNIGPCCNNADDVGFAKAVVQDVAKVACVDLKHVYAVGFSLGGGMVHRLGCEAADTFAAISPAASDLVKETVDKCKPARPLTEISFRGTNDGSVPYAGGTIVSFTGLGAQATFKKWSELDACTGTPSAEDSNGCSTYSSCEGGVQVTLCTKKNGGHEAGNASISWPILKKYALP